MTWRGERVFEMISDADRTTVIGHGACRINPNGSWVCWNFDKDVHVGVVNDARLERDPCEKYDALMKARRVRALRTR